MRILEDKAHVLEAHCIMVRVKWFEVCWSLPSRIKDKLSCLISPIMKKTAQLVGPIVLEVAYTVPGNTLSTHRLGYAEGC